MGVDAFQVVLPLVEKYFCAHKDYFITNPNVPPQLAGNASLKEKEMTALSVSEHFSVVMWF